MSGNPIVKYSFPCTIPECSHEPIRHLLNQYYITVIVLVIESWSNISQQFVVPVELLVHFILRMRIV